MEINTNKAEIKATPLTGTVQEQVNKLLDIAKDRKISLKELKELIPLTKEFVAAFSDTIKTIVQEDTKNNEKFLASMLAINNSLAELIRDGELSADEKAHAFNLISKIIDGITEHEKQRENNSSTLKKLLAVLSAFAVGAVVVLSGGKGGNRGASFQSQKRRHKQLVSI